MTEHTVPAAPIDMPENVIGCRKLLACLQDDIAAIRVQIATNDIRRQTARKGLDPDWFHRARTALRLKQHEVAQVTAHMASLMRGVRHIHFKDTLIAVLREEFDDGEWAKVVDEARARHIELEEESG